MLKDNKQLQTFFAGFLLMAISLLSMLSSCKKEKIFTDSSAKVEFSKDTIVFDTVFVTIGSTYRRFTVRNPYNKKLVISRVRLKSGTRSAFRINVDGVPTTDITDVEIEAKDSIFVFAEVTVDPNSSLNPFVIEDQIIFNTNGNEQKVQLAAWGQNAYFHYNEVVCNETWQNDLPHVLYGITAVGYPGIDSGCFLNIPAGTEIYGHNDAILYVYKSQLNINGSEGNEVLFRGDRLEAAYEDAPGQWFGIRMFQPTESNINHAIIKNGTVGIWIDTADGSDKVNINYTISGNHNYASLFCQGARVKSENSLFYSSAVHTAVLNIGGDYDFNHCTFSNFWSNTTRSTPLMVLNNYYLGADNVIYHRPIVKADFNNCIIYGDKDLELDIDTLNGTTPSYTYNHCMIKTNRATTNSHYSNIKKNTNPNFVNPTEFNFKLRSSSQAISFGDPLFPVSNGDDLDGVVRSAPYDVGCYEYEP